MVKALEKDKDYTIDLDLQEFVGRTDSLFHAHSRWKLAHGKDWDCELTTVGSYRLYCNHPQMGEIWNDDVLDAFNTDDELHRAIMDGVVEMDENNWYEIAFFVNGNYVDCFDIFDDRTICSTPEEAIQAFEDCMKDEQILNAIEEERSKK